MLTATSSRQNSAFPRVPTRRRSKIKRCVRSVRHYEHQAANFSDDTLRDRVKRVVERIGKKPKDLALFCELVGYVAESVFRQFQFRLHDVQLQAILAGCGKTIVEMQTGEGKTVVTGSTAVVKALLGQQVHVATTNSYLAQRDLEELQPVFDFLEVESGLLPEGNSPQQARMAYTKQITYGPGYQFGFDYLRDQVHLRQNRQSRLGVKSFNAISGRDVTRDLMQLSERQSMLVDEADCVMIDEAVTPLVISGGARGVEDPVPFQLAMNIASKLTEEDDFTIKLPNRRIEISDDAMTRCHEQVSNRSDLQLQRPWRIYISNALRAEHVLCRDVDYVVRDDEVQIVDQYTGRIFSDRTWHDGLHQAVEAKEGCTIQSAPPSVARVTRQRYMLMYQQLAGLTGTATNVAHEFQKVYGTAVLPVPTNLPCKRKRLPARFFADGDAKLRAMAQVVLETHKTGQPILIGTRTIEESKQVFETLCQADLDPVVLNGVQDLDEAKIVSNAGQYRSITIATNMAGRGTDIKPDPKSMESGGLHVIGFSPNTSQRIDRQLVGRTARQGNPGTAQMFAAADDDFISDNDPGLAKRMMRNANDQGETRVDFSEQLLAAQSRNELRQAAHREELLQSDYWMDQVRESIDKE